MSEKAASTSSPRLCIVNELGEYFTVRLSGGMTEPTWTSFRAYAYTYRDEVEASEIASRFGGTVQPLDDPDERGASGAVVLPFVRR